MVGGGEGTGQGLAPERGKGLNGELHRAEAQGAKRTQTPAVQMLCAISKQNAAEQRGGGPRTNPGGVQICPFIAVHGDRGLRGATVCCAGGAVQQLCTVQRRNALIRHRGAEHTACPDPGTNPRSGTVEAAQRCHIHRGPDPGLRGGPAHQASASNGTRGWCSVLCDRCTEECQEPSSNPTGSSPSPDTSAGPGTWLVLRDLTTSMCPL